MPNITAPASWGMQPFNRSDLSVSRTHRTAVIATARLATILVATLSATSWAVEIACPPVALWEALPRGTPPNPWDVDAEGNPLPALGQGQNGIHTQSRRLSDGVVTDLVWLNYAGQYQTWGDPAMTFNVPQIYAMPSVGTIFAHPRISHDAVIRIELEGPGGTAAISGATGTGDSTDIGFTIHLDALDSVPIWQGTTFESFSVSFPYANGSVLLLSTHSLGAQEADWAHWINVLIHESVDADLNNDGAINGADLGVLLAAWGPCGARCPADLDCNGTIDGGDLGILLAGWTG